MAASGSIPTLLQVKRKGGQTGKKKPRKGGYVAKRQTAGGLLSRMSSSGY